MSLIEFALVTAGAPVKVRVDLLICQTQSERSSAASAASAASGAVGTAYS